MKPKERIETRANWTCIGEEQEAELKSAKRTQASDVGEYTQPIGERSAGKDEPN